MFPALADIVNRNNLQPFISISAPRQPLLPPPAAAPAVPNMAGVPEPSNNIHHIYFFLCSVRVMNDTLCDCGSIVNPRVRPSHTTIAMCYQRRLEVQWLLDNQPAGCNLDGLDGWANLYDQFMGTQLEVYSLLSIDHF
jgi:hypothetical protein